MPASTRAALFMLLLAVPTAVSAQSVQTTTEFEGVAPPGEAAIVGIHTENSFEFSHRNGFQFQIYSSTFAAASAAGATMASCRVRLAS